MQGNALPSKITKSFISPGRGEIDSCLQKNPYLETSSIRNDFVESLSISPATGLSKICVVFSRALPDFTLCEAYGLSFSPDTRMKRNYCESYVGLCPTLLYSRPTALCYFTNVISGLVTSDLSLCVRLLYPPHRGKRVNAGQRPA
jgi:hypothetical protein